MRYNYMYDIPRYDYGIQEISVFRAVKNIYMFYLLTAISRQEVDLG